MKTLQSAQAKIHFSTVLKDVMGGNEIGITYGKKKETVAVIIPFRDWKKKQKRVLGTLEGKMSVRFAKSFKMTEEEFAGL